MRLLKVITERGDHHRLTGELMKTSGARTYPLSYGYDYAGRMASMTTWSNAATSAVERFLQYLKVHGLDMSQINVPTDLGVEFDGGTSSTGPGASI